MKRIVLWLCVVGVVVSLAGAGWLYWQCTFKHAPMQQVEVMVPHGASSIKIARVLYENDVIASPLVFRVLVRVEGVANRLRSGLYRFEQQASVFDIVARLQRGDVMRFNVTVPEGMRTDEVLGLLAHKTATDLADWQQAYTQLMPEEPEGRLLPETYQYQKPVQIARMLKTMLDAQDKVMAELSTDKKQQQRLRIMASIIEKETRLEQERPLVAAVIYNRLKKHMPLQMDPTVIYGLWKTHGIFSGNIHKKDLRTDTPWNSYTNKGLPPTPIGNPGAASLRAAANPADVTFLFFVADGTGGHQFATTLADHNANVAGWIKVERKQNRAK